MFYLANVFLATPPGEKGLLAKPQWLAMARRLLAFSSTICRHRTGHCYPQLRFSPPMRKLHHSRISYFALAPPHLPGTQELSRRWSARSGKQSKLLDTTIMNTTTSGDHPVPFDDPRTAPKKKMFVTDDGRNVLFTFILLISLFALWGFCNGMIDVMDKHFQEELGLTLAQSAWVQFAHYLGYFLMALPAGWLATKMGYKGGIIAGLLLVAVGGFWFIPATQIASFWAFLLGVCIIAAGLTFLETIANPYTTVLGPIEYGATRINLAQSCNGIGLLLGPIAGGMFFYSKDAAGQSTGAEQLWIPYAAIGVIVIILAVIFYFADVPDIKMEDDYHLDDSTPNVSHSIWSHPHFVMAVAAQFLYVAAQAGIFSFFINYMTSQVPAVPASWEAPTGPASGWFAGWFETHKNGMLGFSDKAAANLASLGFLLLPGRPFHRHCYPQEIRRPHPSRSVWRHQCRALPHHLSQARLDFGGRASSLPISSCPSCSRPSLLWVFLALAQGQKRHPPSSSWQSWVAPFCLS